MWISPYVETSMCFQIWHSTQLHTVTWAYASAISSSKNRCYLIQFHHLILLSVCQKVISWFQLEIIQMTFSTLDVKCFHSNTMQYYNVLLPKNRQLVKKRKKRTTILKTYNLRSWVLIMYLLIYSHLSKTKRI